MSSIDSFFPPSIDIKTEEFNLDKVKNQEKSEAVKYLEQFKMTYRILKEDDKMHISTRDYRLDRLNLTIQNGIVISATYG